MNSTTASRLPVALATAALGLTLTLTGCGLKGALTMPSQSEEIVIRPASGTATEGTVPAEKQVTPQEERLPPPPLPGGNPGTARGG